MNHPDDIIAKASQYDSVLDIGCGPGAYLMRVKARRRVGIDICAAELDLARTAASRVDNPPLFIQLNVMDIVPLFNCAGFECVIGMDIIEHFEKERAKTLIQRCLYVASKCVVFFIPVGVHTQTSDVRGFGNDYYQTHRSSWYPADMEKMGFKVYENPTFFPPKPGKTTGAMICVCEIGS